MSVFCKGCRKTKDDEEFGLKANGTQYKTCIKCRNKKNEKPEEEIIECCGVEAIRNTFKKTVKLCANGLKFMMDLDSGLARAFFNNMIKTRNSVIIETITLSNFCPLMNLFMHLGFDIEDIRTYDTNFVIHKKVLKIH